MKTSLTILAATIIAAHTLHAQIVADGATNTLSNVTNTFTGDVTVGTNGSFTLLVLSDNTLLTNANNGTIGLNSTAKSNEVRLISPTTRWLMAGALYLGSNGSFNQLVVSNGATLRDGLGLVGLNVSASNNLALVTGSGSVWSNTSGFYFGFNGAGNQLVVSNGGTLSSDGQGFLGLNPTASNTLAVVTGPGSTWNNGTEFGVGTDGSGNQLVVSDGASVRNGHGYIGANPTGSNNLALITGAGSVWSNALDLEVGSFGAGNRLAVSNGAALFVTGSGVIGSDTNASGNSVTLTDPGTSWLVGNNLYVGSNGALSRLVVSNGAFVQNNNGFMGNTQGSSNNSAVVTGSGSLWTNTGSMAVGSHGPNNLLIVSNGGWLVSAFGFVGSLSGASNNLAIVTGSGSVWSNVSCMFVGYNNAHSNRLVIEAGGLVTCDNGDVGEFGGRNNMALVTGNGSVWSNRSALRVGVDGSGNQLVVSNAATVLSSNGYLGFNTSSSNNFAVVTGPGSYWSNGTNVYVGNLGSGNMVAVSNGGFVSDFDGVIGSSASSSNNVVVVTGTNSTWTNFADFVVGVDGSNNRLVVDNGGAILADSGGIGGYGNGNQALLTGPGTHWINTGDHFYVGFSGSASQLVISNAAVLEDTFGYMGWFSGSNNLAVVTGSGSVWSNTAELYVGESGSRNQLIVTNNGLVFAATNAVVGFYAGSGSNRVVVDGGTLLVSNSLGSATLEVRGGTNVLNSGLVNVDQLLLTNALGKFEFNGGTLITRGAYISNLVDFVVGRTGTTPAIWDVRAGADHHGGGRVIVGDNSSFNQLILTNGGFLTNSGQGILGQSIGGNSNSVTIAGAGSRWLQLNGDIVGLLGSGNRLVVSNGATLLNSGGSTAIGNDLGSSNNEMVITGPGTTWTSSGASIVTGEGGHDNRLVISDGAQVTSFNGTIGELFTGTSNNLATVTGAGSSWNADTFNVGFNGTGNQLVVSNSAIASATNSVYLGLNATSVKNRLIVDGGALRATNAAVTGLLDIRRGTNVLNAGLIEADILRMTNTLGFIQFNGGTLSVKSSTLANGFPFTIGNGVSPATMTLAGSGMHDFSGVLGVSVSANASFTGNGTLKGTVNILSGGWLIPGASIGKMIFSNAPSLQGTVVMEISKNGVTLTNDQVQVAGTLTYGGTLTVTNIGPTPLANGDRFQLFPAGGYTGAFTPITLPPLNAGLDWTNKLLVDGSIEVFTPPPADRFWTNALGGNYEVGLNWLDNFPPHPQDNANFTNNASYQVNWSSNALAANAFFNAQSGTVTQNIGAFTWALTNSYIVGRDISATAAVTHTSGTLRVTNSQHTAQLIVSDSGRGTFNLNGGEVVADTLLVPNGNLSIFNFASGVLRTRNTSASTGSPFVVGDGASSATFEFLGNGTNNFVNGLTIQSQGALAGNGTLSGAFTVQAGGQLSPGSAGGAPAFGKIISMNSPLLQGVTLLEISRSGAATTNDQLQVLGPLNYGGALTVTNIGTNVLMAGDFFQLFTAASYGGAFTSLSLPSLGPGLSWKTNLLLGGSLEVIAPPAIPLSSGTYTQNFDSLASSGSANLWRDNSTLLGWYAAKSVAPNPITSYRASDGSDNNGTLYSFGTTGSSERALGSIASDSVGNIACGLCFSNDTPTSISNFVVSYTGEQWRSGGTTNGAVTNTLSFWYRVSALVITNPEPGVATNWTEVTNLDFVSPAVLAATTVLDGNQASNQHAFSAVLISGLVVPPGQNVFFRWRDLNDSGADQGMALDDLTITFSALLPQITSVSLNSTSHFLQLSGQGESNMTYAIEAASNLTAPTFWQRIGTNTADSAGLFQFTDTNATAFPLRFYRVVTP